MRYRKLSLGRSQALIDPSYGLVALGVISALGYWHGIAARYPLSEGLQAPHTGWPAMAQYARSSVGAQAAIYVLLMIGYLCALRLALRASASSAMQSDLELDVRAPSHPRRLLVLILAGWLLCSVVLLGAYPGESLDIFDYVFRGRMLLFYHASPLAVAPDQFSGTPFYQHISWRHVVDTYGPLWEYASGAVARTVWLITGDSLPGYISGYRLLAIALTGICGGLIGLIVRQANPSYTGAALVAWLWNPLVVTSSAVGAHNDLLMLVCLLLALRFVQRQRWLIGLLLVGLAGHVKLTGLLLLPLLGIWLIRRRGWRRSAGTVAAALAAMLPLSWLLYAPLGGWMTLPRMLHERTSLIFNSPANVVYTELQWRWAWPQLAAQRVAILGSTLVFLGVAALLLWRFWRAAARADDRLLWRAAVTLTMAYLLIGSFWFQSWYILWVLPVAALRPASRSTRLVLPLYSLGALWASLGFDFLNQERIRHSNALGWPSVNLIFVILLLAPPGIAALALYVRHMKRNNAYYPWGGLEGLQPLQEESLFPLQLAAEPPAGAEKEVILGACGPQTPACGTSLMCMGAAQPPHQSSTASVEKEAAMDSSTEAIGLEPYAQPVAVVAIIPALNEVQAIPHVVRAVPRERVQRVIVVDNGSTDGTAQAAARAGADVVAQPRRGYGNACRAGADAARDADILVFLDGDGSFEPAEVDRIIAPILLGRADLVLGSRELGGVPVSALLPHQRLGNRLVALLLRRLYGIRVTDVGPFRAIRRSTLDALDMRETSYGWPTEMVVKAARIKARIAEVPASYRARLGGTSKVSGTLRGTVIAGYRMLALTLKYAWP